MIRNFALFILLCLGAPSIAQPPAPAPSTVRVLLHTSEGDIIVALETQRAPITVFGATFKYWGCANICARLA